MHEIRTTHKNPLKRGEPRITGWVASFCVISPKLAVAWGSELSAEQGLIAIAALRSAVEGRLRQDFAAHLAGENLRFAAFALSFCFEFLAAAAKVQIARVLVLASGYTNPAGHVCQIAHAGARFGLTEKDVRNALERVPFANAKTPQ